MLDGQELVTVLQQHGVDTASLTHIADFENGTAYRLSVKGVEALGTWQTLRGLVGEMGRWPVIVGEYGSIEDISDRGVARRPPQEIIEEGLHLDFEQVLRENLEGYMRAYDQSLSEALPRGEWPEPGAIPAAPSELTGGHLERAHIMLLPTVEGWQAPAYLNFGGWNDCPNPPEHVCLLKHWQEQYGAEVMGMTDTIIEMRVSRPPRDRNSAMTLAVEHRVYCNESIGYDLVTNTIEDLAARLLDAPHWYFWWD
ncbi:MAG TPA: DUF4253 domain-containing protein [Ktedonobacterales bacterium]